MSHGLLSKRHDIRRDPSWFGLEMDPALPTRWEEFTLARDALAAREPGRVLDAGCGFVPGSHVMPEIAAGLGWHVEAIDLLTEKWGDLREKWHEFEPHDRINRRVLDMCATDYDDASFDAYLNISVLEHMTPVDRDRAMDEAYRVLKPGGLIVVTMDGERVYLDPRFEFGAPYTSSDPVMTDDGVPVSFMVGEKRRKPLTTHVTIAATVYNEADRFLRRALECWQAVSDRIIVLDNGSTDATPDILSEFGCEVHDYTVSMEGNETAVMSRLWDIAVEDSDWVVFMDADQCFAGDFRRHLRGRRCGFPLFDLWSPKTYRLDRWWRVRPWTKAVRVDRDREIEWEWPERGWHTGHVPRNVGLLGMQTEIPRECGVLHYACASQGLRERQFQAYMGRRAYLTPIEVMHARTIMDPEPNTPELPFEPAWTLM